MIDIQVQNLLAQAIDSPLKLHLLLIFHEHSRFHATPSRMAERACRDIWSVRQALHELAEDDVLQVGYDQDANEPLYWYQPHRDFVEPIRHLVHNYNDPLSRNYLLNSLRNLAVQASYRRAPLSETMV